MDNSIRTSAAACRMGGRPRGRAETAADRLGPVPTVRVARPAARPAAAGGEPRLPARAGGLAWLRAAVCAAVVTLVLLIAIGVGADEGEPEPAAFHLVAPADTLWSIASAYAAPGSDLRRLAADIREANDMTGSNLRVGQRIVVPLGGR